MSENRETMRGLDLPKKKPKLQLGENYLFIVGINKYNDHSLPKLNNAVLDAKKVRDILVEKYQFNSKEDRFKELYDGDATQVNIIKSLRHFSEKLNGKDTFLIYFAGHGEYDSTIDVGYWIPSDAENGNIGSYISFDMISRWLKAIKSRHTFVMTDSCHSGSFFTNNRDANRVKDRLETLASRWLLTAGRNEPVPDGRPGEHSPFAKAVLYHLDHNEEERFRVSELCNHVLVSVGNNSDALPRFGALKNVGDMGGEFMFRLKEVADKVFDPIPSLPKTDGELDRGNNDKTIGEEPNQKDEEKVETPMRTLEDVQERIKDLLKEDEFEKVFEMYDRILDKKSRRETDIIMQQSQYNGIRKQMRNGLVDPGFANITLNRIRLGLNSITGDLKEEDLAKGVLEPESGSGASGLDDQERQGLIEQADLLKKKLNYFEKEKIKAYDVNQKFALDEEIKKIKQQLEDIKNKL
ncbi:MAG: caspase family protein [Chitinophagales bacterium]|nr:caspase family protein [Chitinophagales bacterium]